MKDCVGQEVKVGDTIVYFTRQGSSMYNQKAKVELLLERTTRWSGRPCVLVLREDAVEKNRFTRKAWLWSLDNAVRISSPDRDVIVGALDAFEKGVQHLLEEGKVQLYETPNSGQ